MKQLFGVLLLIAFVKVYFWWVLLTAGMVLIVWMAWTGFWEAKRDFEAEQRARSEECRRLIVAADCEHGAVMRGDLLEN